MYFVRYNFRIFFLFIGFFLFSESIKAQKPGWQPPNPSLYTFSNSVTAVIKFDGNLTLTLEDTIAFYVGNEIRGISNPIKIGNVIRHYAAIYSSLTSESIKLKVYHALSNKVYDVMDSLTFMPQTPIGDFEKPYEVILFSSGDAPISIDSLEDKFTFQNIPFDTIDLKPFLNQTDTDLVTWSVSPHPDFVINISGNNLHIIPRNGFIGSGVIEIKATEQTINANYATQNLKLNVLRVPVLPGWDSIPGQGIQKGNSFKSFLLTDYENKYQGNCLVFDYLPILPEIGVPEPVPQWVVQQTYLNSMTFIARPVFTPILPFNHPDDLLAAYIDGELRGVAEPQIINGQILYFLGVGSQQSAGVITFHFYSGALKRKFIAPVKISYITSAVRGSVEIPYEINLSPIQPIIDSNSLVQLQIIDSAWVGKIDFRFQAKDCSYSILSAAARSLLETFTYVPFWVTSNNADLFTFYKDFDGDGFGDPNVSQTIANANPPPNYVTNNLDCDDSDDAVNPSPSIAAVQDVSLCLGMLTDSILFKRGSNGINSPSSKTIYKWTNNNTAIGLAASGTGNIVPFLTKNIKSRNDTAQIIVTPEINGCLGVKDTFLLIVKAEALSTYYKDDDGDGFGNPAVSVTICDLNAPANYVSNKLDCDDGDNTIKPYPTLTAVQDKSFCFGMFTDSINFTRSINGIVVNSNKISYKWTNNNTTIGLAASGSENIVPFLTKNIKSRNDTAQIIVTPEINGCLGVKDTFLLIVRAEALSTYYKDDDGDGFGNPAVSVTICDLNAPANYVANKLDCDDGDNTIKPYPTLTAVQDKSSCFGMFTDSINFTRSINGIVVNSNKISYKWTNNNTAIGLAASGSENIVPFLTKNIKSRNDTAQIIVTPEINGCLGIKDTFLLIVRAEALSTYYKDDDGDGFGNPAVSVTICDVKAPANYVANKLDCDDGDNTINPYPTLTAVQDKSFCFGMFTDSVNFNRSVNGIVVNSNKISYKWTNNNPAIGLGASGSGNILPFLTKNIKSRNDTAQIIVTPEINGCLGIKDTFLLIVRAEALSTYYKDDDGDGFGNPAVSVTICDLNVPANYVANKLDCDDGDNTIKPYPTVTNIQDKSFCFGMLTDSIVFTRSVNGMVVNSSKISYKWINNNPGIGLAASGSGNILPFITTNTKSSNDTAQIIVTPEINGCLGIKDTFLLIVRAEALSTYYKDEDGDGFGNPAISVTICDFNAPANYVANKIDCDDGDNTINPYGTVTNTQDKSFCIGILTDSIVFTRSVNGIVVNSSNIIFQWVNNNTDIGLVASGRGNILPFFTTNIKNRNDTAQIIVTPEINGCAGIQDTFLLIVKADSLPRVSSLNCLSYSISSMVLPNANDLYQNTLRLPYAGGNGIRYDSIIIKSEGVSGLTLKLKPGLLSKGDGFLEFDLNGIPLQAGSAKFIIDFGRADCHFGPPCEINLEVGIERPNLNEILCSQVAFLPGKIYAKVPYYGKIDLPYLGGNEKLAPAQLFQSEGIRGMTAKFNADTLRRNGGLLRFNLDGMPEQTGTLNLVVEIGSKSCVLNLLIEEFPVILPKFFSPNGDGNNERWEIPYFNILYPQGTVIILDRYGRKLLEYKGNFEGWDGNIGGFSASTGVYWYIVQLEKDAIPIKGNFTLVR